MPDFQITSPDGSKYQVTAPEGATEQDALKFVQTHRDTLSKLPIDEEHKAVFDYSNPAMSDPMLAAGDPNLSLHDIGQMGRGFVAGALGAPGDAERFALKFVPGGDKEANVFPTSETVGKKLFGTAKDERDKGYRELGGAVGSLVGPGTVAKASKSAIEATPKALETTGRVLPLLKPGALKSADEAIKAAQSGVASDVGAVSDKSILGEKMYRDLKTRVDSLLDKRATAENELRAKYLAEGIPVENDIAKDYSQELLKAEIEHTHPEERELLEGIATNLTKDRSLHGMILEKRRLQEISEGKLEGYGANKKILAGQMANKLNDIIKKRVPAYADYARKYAEMSEDINLFQDTAFGRRITTETSRFMPDVPKFEPATVPGKSFDTVQSVKILRKLSGGNEKFVNEAASEHAATELKDKSAKEARKWLEKNREWLNEVPKVKADVEDYVTKLERLTLSQEKIVQARKNLAKVAIGTGVAGGIVSGYRTLTDLLP